MVKTPFDKVTSASDNFEFSSIRISNFSHKDSKVSSLAFSKDISSWNDLTKVGFWPARIGLKNLVWGLGFQFCPKVFWMQRNLLNIFEFLSSSFQNTRLDRHTISTIFSWKCHKMFDLLLFIFKFKAKWFRWNTWFETKYHQKSQKSLFWKWKYTFE